MRTIFFAVLFVILILLSGALTAQSFSSLDDIKAYALENSLDYKKAAWAALSARNDVDGILELEETSFSSEADYDSSSEEWSASSGIDLPLVDQLSLNGTYYSDNSSELGLSFSPLTHSDSRVQQAITLQKALAYAGETAITAETEALSAALYWMVKAEEIRNQEEAVSVAELLYRDEKVRYDEGESTLDDVREYLMDWTEARTVLSDLQKELREKESDLMTALNVNPAEVNIAFLGNDVLEEELNKLKLSVVPEKAVSAGTYSVLSSYLDMKSVEESLDDIWLFNPSLVLEADVVREDNDTTWEASVEFSFSLQDWQKDDRIEMQTDLEISRQEAYQAEQAGMLDLQQARIALESSAQNRELARIEEEQAAELYEEALYLYDLGEYSQAERDDAALTLKSAETSLFSALADEYLAWREMLLYLP